MGRGSVSGMVRSRTLSYALWSTLAAGCGGDGKAGQLADAPPAGPVAVLPSPAAVTASAECGVAIPAVAELTIGNAGTKELVISAASADGGFTVTTALPVTIAAGAQGKLAIRPPAAVIGTDRGGATKAGTLTLTTNEDGTQARTVALTATVVGANIAITNAAGQPVTLAFSSASGCPAPQAVFIRNTGNAPAMVGAAMASGFGFDGFSGGVVAAGAAPTQMVRPVTTADCMRSEAITYQVSGSTCGASTAALQATFNITGSSTCACS